MAESRSPTGDGKRPQRAQSTPQALSSATIQWLAELPAHVRPNDVATRFPHIANQLSSLWPKEVDCRAYFDDLLLDQRGDRTGFPGGIAFELAALKNHYDSVVFPSHQTVWDDIITRSRA